jgi:hypothetical protein
MLIEVLAFATEQKKLTWNYETVSMILVPILLGSAAVYIYWHSKRRDNIAKIEAKIRYIQHIHTHSLLTQSHGLNANQELYSFSEFELFLLFV